MAKDFYWVQVGNGATTSFRFDDWSELGRIHDLTGTRGYIDLGISEKETVEMVMTTHRARRHQVDSLNCIEDEFKKIRNVRTWEKDMALWRDSAGKFKKIFTSKETWKQICNAQPITAWYKGMWFKHATPKFSFHASLAVLNRLSTIDRMVKWNSNTSTVCFMLT